MSENTTPKKILFYVSSPLWGGAERVLFEVLRSFPIEHSSKWLFIIPGEGELASQISTEFPQANLMILPFPKFFARTSQKSPLKSLIKAVISAPRFINYLQKIKKQIQNFQPSHFYAQGIKAQLLSTQLKGNFELIWHVHDHFPSHSFVRHFLGIARKTPRQILSISRSVQSSLLPTLPSSWSSQRRVIHNGVDTEKFSLLEQKEKKSGQLHFTIVGMLTEWKGQHIFIEAARQILEQYPDCHFSLVGATVYENSGQGSYEDQLKNQILSAGLEGKIQMLGALQNTAEHLRNCDVAVHASIKPEPFGLVIIEAMASGLATIAARAGGALEIIDDGKDGLLFEPNNPSELAQKMKQLLESPQLIQTLCRNGRKKVENSFSISCFQKKVQDAFNS